jgi:hypothetical protein
VSLDAGPQGGLAVGAHDAIYLDAVSQENDGGNPADSHGNGPMRIVVNVELGKCGSPGELGGQLVQQGYERPARRTPGSPEINHDQTLGVENRAFERLF